MKKNYKTVTIRGRERVPVNKMAKLHTTPSPDSNYVYENKSMDIIYDAPLPTREPDPSMIDLRGSKSNGVTIVGYIEAVRYKEPSGRKRVSHKWLARCRCGKYVIRDGYKWRKSRKKGLDDCGCKECEHLAWIQKKEKNQ